MTELVWDGKNDANGRRVAPLRVALPFQTVETVNESAQERQKALDLFSTGRDAEWRNRLIWGDKKYMLPSLLAEFAGRVDLIYIDPPFDTGANFSYQIEVTGQIFVKAPSIIEQKAISSNVAEYVTVKTFVAALRAVVVEELEPKLLNGGRPLSETPPFPYSRITRKASKTVFNLVACDNAFEAQFAAFLEDAEDVDSFAKLPEQFGFSIQYTDSTGNLRYYEPDFVARLTSGELYLIETKGREDPDVRHKDRAARIWCENASMLTGQCWQYLKVPQLDYNKLHPDEFADLAIFTQAPLPN